MKPLAAACLLAAGLAGCVAPVPSGTRDSIVSGSAAASAPAARFAPGGPDAEEYGATEGFPAGDRTTFFRIPFLVGSHSQLDQVFEGRLVRRADTPSRLARAAAEPAIQYYYQGAAADLDRYLSRNPATGLLIARGDTILIERYQYGRNDRHRFTSWSMAKTVTSMLIGIAIAEGRIRSVDDPAAVYVPVLAGTEYGRTSLRHLLQMSSGVRFVEEYSGRDDVAQLSADTFRQVGAGGVEAVTRYDQRVLPAGSKFSYASVETQVLGLVLRNAVGRPVADYLSEKIWQPMGAEADATWLVDRAGQESTYLLHQRRAARRCSAGIAAGSRRQLARPADHPGHLDRGGHARASGAGPSQAGRRDTVPRLWLPGLDRAGRAPDTRAPRRAWSDDPG